LKEKVQGNLVIIGGAEDKTGDCVILRKVVELAGGDQARLVIVPTATEEPEAVSEEYKKVFRRLGAGQVEVLFLDYRRQANDRECREIMREATGLFFTGGDQLRITSILGGSLIDDELHEAYRRGVVIAGTSAGASMMSDIMIVEGNSEEPPRRCTLKMAPGMGLLLNAVVDQHFAQRGRINRLLCAIAQNPNILGIGIDEDTAIVVSPDNLFEVIGNNSVTIIDGRAINETNVSETEPDEHLAITNVVLHVLPAGYRFDLLNRKPILR